MRREAFAAVAVAMLIVAQQASAQEVNEGFELAAPESAFDQPRQVRVRLDGDEFVTLPYYNVDNMAVLEGDILLGTAEELALINLLGEAGTDLETLAGGEEGGAELDEFGTGAPAVERGLAIKRTFGGKIRRWPNNTVSFVIESNVAHAQQIRQAMQHWEDKTALEFEERTPAHQNFVVFHDPGVAKCSSFVGMQGGPQVINLSSACGLGATIHEIGHAIGLGHEHTRADRDNFVEVIFSNINPQAAFNFHTNPTKMVDMGLYDYGSIMHYSGKGFAVDTSKPTIVPKQAGVTIGQRQGLSAGDIATVAAMYP